MPDNKKDCHVGLAKADIGTQMAWDQSSMTVGVQSWDTQVDHY
jgi:hypothetical protein